MPNRPLMRQPIFVPFYAGLNTELADKLVQPQGGVLELENMVANQAGEMSKRAGNVDIITPSTPTLPAGGTLDALYELAPYRSELVRLARGGANPITSYVPALGALANPAGAGSALSTLYRGPLAVSMTDVVDAVTVGAGVQAPTMATAGDYGIAVYEQVSALDGSISGIVEVITDARSGKPVYTQTVPGAYRPRAIAIGPYLLVFYCGADTSIYVDVCNTSAMSLPASFNLTGTTFVNSSSILAVTAGGIGIATLAFTNQSGLVMGLDYTPSTNTTSIYDMAAASTFTFHASIAMGWMRDFGNSGELSLICADATDGVIVHWGFGAPLGGVRIATAEYTIDNTPWIGQSAATALISGVMQVAGYTTSASSTGEFVVMYDYLATGDSAKSIVYRGTRVGSTLTAGAPYWYASSLVSDFWHPGDGGTYILVSFSNSANPGTPQNTYFVCADGKPRPIPQATVLAQAAGGFNARPSSLTQIASNPVGDPLMAIRTLADEQFFNGTPLQIGGLKLLTVSLAPAQDTSTSPPVEMFGNLVVPGGTMMAYDGRTYGEALFPIRPEPPRLILANVPNGAPTAITHSATDQVIGAPLQPLAVTPLDFYATDFGTPHVMTHNASDVVSIVGGEAIYVFLSPSIFILNIAERGGDAMLDQMFSGAGSTLAIANTGTAGNNGSFVINSLHFNASNNSISVHVTQTTQSAAALGPSTVVSLFAATAADHRLMLQGPGSAIITSDPTWQSQLVKITDVYGTIGGQPDDTGVWTLDAATPCGSVTIGGRTYSFLQFSSPPTTPETWQTQLPTVSLQLANPATANTWTLTNATFDQSYVGAVLTVANALNPANNGQFEILTVLSATQIVTTGPADTSKVLRNENLGATGGITYSITPRTNIPNGSHSYVAVFSRIDALGRKWRSAPSLPASITTSTGFAGVSAIVEACPFTGWDANIELYRSQTGVGGQYNLAATVANDPQSIGIMISDNLSDTSLAEQEELFTDGGIIPPTAIGSVSAVASFQGRPWVLSPEAPQSLFYGNPDNVGSGGSGDGILLNTTTFSVDIIDEYGPITAFAPMYDQAMIVFKANAVYAVTGTGPDGSGQNGGYNVQRIATGVGCGNPRSLGLNAGGIWFDSESERNGIFTVTRGLTIEPTGAGVRRYVSENITATVSNPNTNQLRFYTASGRTLTWDSITKIWGTFTGQPCASAVLFQGVPTYAPSSGPLFGYVLQESPGVFNSTPAVFQEGTPYVGYTQRVASAWLSIGGLKGWERWFRLQGVGKSVGDHVLTVKIYADYDDNNLIATASKAFNAGDDWDWEVLPPMGGGKVDAFKVVLEGADPAGATTGTAGFSVTGITILSGVKRGLFKLPDTARLR